VQLIPNAVGVSKIRQQQPWWLSVSTTRVIVSEYVKFLPAAARMLASRTLNGWDANNVADGTKPPLAKTSGL
jgi:hypothetical protein